MCGNAYVGGRELRPLDRHDRLLSRAGSRRRGRRGVDVVAVCAAPGVVLGFRVEVFHLQLLIRGMRVEEARVVVRVAGDLPCTTHPDLTLLDVLVAGTAALVEGEVVEDLARGCSVARGEMSSDLV